MPQSNLQSPTSSLTPLRERDLFHLWIGQRFPQEALVTVRGERLRAVYRGRPGRGAGPDFRDAIIAAPEGLLQGDVELHVRSGDFRRHGHHLDPAYDGLALHVVFEHDGDADETELACGRRVPVVALAGWLERREREIRGWLARPALWEEPCRSAVARLGAAETGATLDRLGDMRFRQKAAAFGAGLATRNSQLATRAADSELRTHNSELPTPSSGRSSWRGSATGVPGS